MADPIAPAEGDDFAGHLRQDLAPEPSPPVEYTRPAGVRIPLAHPFRIGGRLVEEITIPPVSLGVALDVQAGVHATLLDILVAVTGEPIDVFRALRGGDEDLVLGTFVQQLPQSIRDLIGGAF